MTETVRIGDLDYELIHKTHLILDDQEYRFPLKFDQWPATFTVVVNFRNGDKPGPINWKWEGNNIFFEFIGWRNSLGMMSLKEKGKLGEVAYNNRQYSIYFHPVHQYVDGVNLLHFFFYLRVQ